ncbi:O-antigen ligase family protein [Paenibacillus sp. A3]|uniref:O-antigen ligase family protein n=1 Tax=Paenibacillus sp. A3 TaxID=1337054 RepID=UPI0006D56C21|nr:O-antigen ligase family protein [Paenibacillus sp. A3]
MHKTGYLKISGKLYGHWIGKIILSWLLAGYLGYAIGLKSGDSMMQLVVVMLVVFPALLLAWHNSLWFLPYNLFVWVTAPEMRRIYDWLTESYHSMSLISVLPLVVSLLMVIPIVRALGDFPGQVGKGLLWLLGAMGYALLIGLARNGSASLFDLANTLVPLLWLPYIVAYRPTVQERDTWMLSFVHLAVFIAFYGMIQFVVVPPWDAFWMDYSGMTSIGKPNPFEIRVFSTLNSPGPAGSYLSLALAAMLLVKKWRGAFGWAGVMLVAMGSIVTLVRSGWVLAAVALIVFIAISKEMNRLKSFSILAGFILFIYACLLVVPQGQDLLNRFATFGDMENDHSFNERMDLTNQLLPMLLSNPQGLGLGGVGTATRLQNGGELSQETGVFDSGIGSIMMTYGLIGTAAFCYGLWSLFKSLCSQHGMSLRERSYTRFGIAVMTASFTNLFFSNSYNSILGVLIWFCVAMGWNGSEPSTKGD